MTTKTVILNAAAAVILISPNTAFAQFSPSMYRALQSAAQATGALNGANASTAAQLAASAAAQLNAASQTSPQAAALPVSGVLPAPAPALGPKKAGTVRIGIALPQASQAPGVQFNPREELRNEWIQLLTGPNVEPVKIAAGLPEQAVAEAKLLNCDYIIFSTLSQKTDNSGMKKLGLFRAASSMIPMAGMGSGVAGMVATSAAQSALEGASAMGSLVKAKQEVSLQYSMITVDTRQSVVQNTSSAKAAQDGQDVITPLLTQAAGAVFSKVQIPQPAA